jgi:hypothetical protein
VPIAIVPAFGARWGVINEGLRRLVPNFAKDRKGQWVSFPILSSPYRESLQLGDAFRLIAGPLWDSPLRTVFAALWLCPSVPG